MCVKLMIEDIESTHNVHTHNVINWDLPFCGGIS